MQRVERPNRLGGERLPSTVNDCWSKRRQRPGCRRRLQKSPAIVGFGFAQLGLRSYEGTVTFDERQVRRRDIVGVAERDLNDFTPGLVQEPREDGARLGIEVQRSPRSSSSSRLAVPGGVIRGRVG